MAGNITGNALNLGNSTTDAQNFVLRTNSDGTGALLKGAAGTLGTVLAFDNSNRVTFPNSTIGATGGGTGSSADFAFFENDVFVENSYTIGGNAYVTGYTISIASPAVFTLAAHGLIAGSVIHLATTGALPTGLTATTVYYVLATGLTTSAFSVATTAGGTAINTSGTQSGVQSVGKLKNAMMTGPLIVATGAAVTVPSGARLVIL